MSRNIPKLTTGLRMLIAMHSAGYKPGEMSQKVGLNRHTTTGHLYGRHQPSHAALVMWADICDVDLDWLINGTMEDMVEEEPKQQSAPVNGLSRDQLTQMLMTQQMLIAQLLGKQQPDGLPTLAELDLMPDLIDLTQEPAVVVQIHQLAS